MTNREDEKQIHHYLSHEAVDIELVPLKNDSIIEDFGIDEFSTSRSKNIIISTGGWQLWQATIIAWISMVFAIISAASIGPIFKFMGQHAIRPCLASSWRCQTQLIFLIPLAFCEYWYDPVNNQVDWFVKKPDLRYSVITHVCFAGLSWAGNLLFWVIGLQYTSTFMASVISCSYPVLLVFWLQVYGIRVSWLEVIGVWVAFVGMIVSCLPDALYNTTNNALHIELKYELLGYGLCLLASACEVVILMDRLKTKQYVPLMQVIINYKKHTQTIFKKLFLFF